MSEHKPYTLEDFIHFIDFHNSNLIKLREDQSEQLQAYARMTKLVEESGELANAIFHYYGRQRKTKNLDDPKLAIEGEIADVFIVLSVIARHFDLDIPSLLEKKAKAIERRWHDQEF